MAKEKKYVKVQSEETEGKEGKVSYATDSKGNLHKVEKESAESRKGRASSKRIIAVLCWLAAVCFEVLAIIRLLGKGILVNAISNDVTFVIICIAIDLIFAIIGSLFWKKANHIDPASSKQPVKFWINNNLGLFVAIVAFLPLVIFILTNKDLDKKNKTILTTVAVAALAIAGLVWVDRNPVSLEDLELDKAKIELVNPDGIVWVVEDAGSSHKYHLSDDCYHIKNRETEAITIEEAYERSITDMCNDCYKKALKEKGYTSDQIDKILNATTEEEVESIIDGIQLQDDEIDENTEVEEEWEEESLWELLWGLLE